MKSTTVNQPNNKLETFAVGLLGGVSVVMLLGMWHQTYVTSAYLKANNEGSAHE